MRRNAQEMGKDACTHVTGFVLVSRSPIHTTRQMQVQKRLISIGATDTAYPRIAPVRISAIP